MILEKTENIKTKYSGLSDLTLSMFLTKFVLHQWFLTFKNVG